MSCWTQSNQNKPYTVNIPATCSSSGQSIRRECLRNECTRSECIKNGPIDNSPQWITKRKSSRSRDPLDREPQCTVNNLLRCSEHSNKKVYFLVHSGGQLPTSLFFHNLNSRRVRRQTFKSKEIQNLDYKLALLSLLPTTSDPPCLLCSRYFIGGPSLEVFIAFLRVLPYLRISSIIRLFDESFSSMQN